MVSLFELSISGYPSSSECAERVWKRSEQEATANSLICEACEHQIENYSEIQVVLLRLARHSVNY